MSFITSRRCSGPPSGIVLASVSGTYSGLLTMSRCDTACAAEVAAVLAHVPGQPPVQAIIHSGGMLADAVIPSQTAVGMRYASLWFCYLMQFKMMSSAYLAK